MQLRLIEIKIDGDYTEKELLYKLSFVNSLSFLTIKLSATDARGYVIGKYYTLKLTEA